MPETVTYSTLVPNKQHITLLLTHSIRCTREPLKAFKIFKKMEIKKQIVCYLLKYPFTLAVALLCMSYFSISWATCINKKSLNSGCKCLFWKLFFILLALINKKVFIIKYNQWTPDLLDHPSIIQLFEFIVICLLHSGIATPCHVIYSCCWVSSPCISV